MRRKNKQTHQYSECLDCPLFQETERQLLQDHNSIVDAAFAFVDFVEYCQQQNMTGNTCQYKTNQLNKKKGN